MDALARLAARDAETSRLLGADFVPAYRARSAQVEAPPPPSARPAPVEPAPPEVVVVARPTPARPPAKVPVVPPSGSAMDDLRARYERDAPHTKFITAHTSIV